MSQSLFRHALQSRISAAAVYYALLLCSLFLPQVAPALLHSDGNQLGIAVLEGVDAAARNLSFYRFIFIFIAALLILHLVLTRGFLKIPPGLRQFSESLAKVGILLTLFTWLESENTWFAVLPSAVHMGFFLCKPFHREVSETNAKTALFYALLTWLSLQWLIPANLNIAIQWLELFIIFGIFSWFGASAAKRENLLNFHGPSIAWIAVLPFLTLEFQYGLFNKYNLFISPYLVWSVFTIALLFFALRRKLPQVAAELKSKAWLVLSIGFGIMAFYRPSANAPDELFELANRAVPLMEYHFFRTIPLLEKASSHFLSDYGFGLIYQAIHGYHGLDFLIYDVFDQIIWIITGFYVIKKFSSDDITAFFFVCLFPLADASFPPYYAAAILLPMLYNRFIEDKSNKSAILFSLAFALLLPWRADLSFAWIIAMLPLLAIPLIKKEISFRSFIPLIIAVGLLIVFLIGISAANSIDCFESLGKSLNYLSSTDSYALPDLGHASPALYVFSHLILPLIVALIALKLSIRQFSSNGKNRSLGFILLFMSVFYLVNLPRGIVRHGYAEGFDNFLLSFGPLIAIVFMSNSMIPRKQSRTTFLFIALSVFGLYMRYPAREAENTPARIASLSPLQAQEFTRKPGLNRLNSTHKELQKEILPLASWLRSQLKAGETFLDMGNTPMLYYYAEKPVPSFFYQSPQNVHSIEMQKLWVEELKTYNIPIVLMRHVPENWWDKTDGVPNEIRHYPVFEYLYQHYCFAEVKYGYEIWKDCNSQPVDEVAFNERQLYRYFELKGMPSTISLPAVKFVPANPVGGTSFQIPENRPEWVQLKINSGKSNEAAGLTIIHDELEYGGFTFSLSNKRGAVYNIRLSTLYAWWKMQPEKIRINLPEGCTIQSVQFAKEVDVR